MTLTFDGYAMPTLQTAWTVKVLAGVFEPAGGGAVTAQPAVRFHDFKPAGFVLRILRSNKLLDVQDLLRMRLMLEVTRSDNAP